MPAPSPCVPCCSTPQLVNIPGLDSTVAGPNTVTAATTTTFTGILAGKAGIVEQLPNSPPTAITDNSTGTQTNTIAPGAGIFTLPIPFRANAITSGVLLFTYTPGYKFKIIRISAAINDAITTGAKAATLTTAIDATPTTGGAVVLSGAYALGSQQASSAAISAANTGTSASTITITASAVTQFTEGGFMFNIEIQNMDTADAIASLSHHVNDLITALTP